MYRAPHHIPFTAYRTHTQVYITMYRTVYYSPPTAPTCTIYQYTVYYVLYRVHAPICGKVVASSPRYLRVEFEAAKSLLLPPSLDDAEFYFTPGDALVQFRSARRSGPADFGANRKRMDSIRIALNFESVSLFFPLLNRIFLFVYLISNL